MKCNSPIGEKISPKIYLIKLNMKNYIIKITDNSYLQIHNR